METFLASMKWFPIASFQDFYFQFPYPVWWATLDVGSALLSFLRIVKVSWMLLLSWELKPALA